MFLLGQNALDVFFNFTHTQVTCGEDKLGFVIAIITVQIKSRTLFNFNLKDRRLYCKDNIPDPAPNVSNFLPTSSFAQPFWKTFAQTFCQNWVVSNKNNSINKLDSALMSKVVDCKVHTSGSRVTLL